MTDRHAWERPGAFEVAPGVHRIPLPLPGDALKAVNVYALRGEDGVTLIDAGWAIDAARERLAAGLQALDAEFGDVRRVLVTHVHRDHYELGLFLRQQFGSHLALGAGEEPSLQQEIDRVPPEQAAMTWRLISAGAAPLFPRLDAAMRNRSAEGDDDGRREDRPRWELPDEWLQDRQEVSTPRGRLQVLATPGHTQGHVVYVDHAGGLLFSGDHVLPHITPSIGFESVPVESALADYLASLAVVRGLPDLRLLPAHGPVQETTHDRVDALLAHHEHRLDASEEAVRAGHATAYEVAQALPWTRRETPFDDLDPFNQMLAVNETLAHLDVLVRRDRCGVEETEGVRHFRV